MIKSFFTAQMKLFFPFATLTKGKNRAYCVCKSLVDVHMSLVPTVSATAIATGHLPKPVGASSIMCL
ncbi:MAG: hypothetical protein WB988_17665 [Candidatus Nitrosopolaris sp.]